MHALVCVELDDAFERDAKRGGQRPRRAWQFSSISARGPLTDAGSGGVALSLMRMRVPSPGSSCHPHHPAIFPTWLPC